MTQGILNWATCKRCGEKYDCKDCPYCLRKRMEEKDEKKHKHTTIS